MTLPIAGQNLHGGDFRGNPEGEGFVFRPDTILSPLLRYWTDPSHSQNLPKGFLNHLRSLGEETQADIFYGDLLGLARHAERRDRADLAAGIYQVLSEATQVPPAILRNAEQRMQVLQGGGPLALRMERWSGQLLESLGDPALLAGMTAGGLAFRAGRLAGWVRFTGAGRAAWGVRAASYTLGMGAETLAFTGTLRGVHALMGRPHEASWESWVKELAGTAIVLGSLRLVGGTVQQLSSHPLAHQVGMYGGIVLGNGLQGSLGFRPVQRPSDLLIESLVMLVHFNAGGILARGLLGRHFAGLEQRMESRIRQLEGDSSYSVPRFKDLLKILNGGERNFQDPRWIPALAGIPRGEEAFLRPWMMAESLEDSQQPLANLTLADRPGMGIVRLGTSPEVPADRTSRRSMENLLHLLMPEGRVTDELVDDPKFVPELLKAFNVTDHALDQSMFREGYRLARQYPQTVEHTAWDMDEVILHWSANMADIFRAPFRGTRDAEYQNTPQELLNYQPFQSRASTRLSFLKRIWFEGLQRLIPTRLRQHVQFHPGVRAYLLGLRLGQSKPLVLATTGPAGRVLLLANEDPALKQIFFGKLPTEAVTMEEVRELPNIYTREDLVLGMRRVLSQEVAFPQDSMVRDYVRRVREFPKGGVKMKHPALARLLGKRSFYRLVDDSATAYQMLSDVPGFRVFQPPSARPTRTLNFVLGSPDRYLDGMSNGYIQELARIFGKPTGNPSQAIPTGTLPAGYPHQRFTIEIPWRRFGEEFYRPAQELRDLAKEVSNLQLPESGEYPWISEPLRLSSAERLQLARRFEQEVELLVEGREARVRAFVESGLEIRDRALKDPERLFHFLKENFHPNEIKNIRTHEILSQEGNTNYFSNMAGILAAKRAVLNLLGLPAAGHLHEIYFRYGRPQVEGEVARRLGHRNLMTSQSSEGEIGVGLALLEPGVYESGLASLGIHITTARMARDSQASPFNPLYHALAESAYKATYRFHPIQRYPHHGSGDRSNPTPEMQESYQELKFLDEGKYVLEGKTAAAAQAWLGSTEKGGVFLARGRDFQVGPAISALMVLPGPQQGEPAQLWRPLPLPGTANAFNMRGQDLDGPYSANPQGSYQIPFESQTVAVLGDITAFRTFELYSQGHRVLHIDRDPQYMYWSQRAFDNNMRRAQVIRTRRTGPSVQWMEADWFQTRAQADYVEAYFPLSHKDVGPGYSPRRQDGIRFFMEQALHTKLRSGGRGIFVISEEPSVISEMKEILAEDPRWEILEVETNQSPAPLRGGHNAHFDAYQKYSWIIYRPQN